MQPASGPKKTGYEGDTFIGLDLGDRRTNIGAVGVVSGIRASMQDRSSELLGRASPVRVM